MGTDDDFGQSLWVLAIVTNDEGLHLDADQGNWDFSGTSQEDCPNNHITVPAPDEDCNDNGTTGDKVVVDMLDGAGVADVGDAIVTVTGASSDVVVEMDYTVVGLPDNLTLTATKSTLQEGATDAQCDIGDFTGSIANASVTGLLAVVADKDDTALTGISVDWSSDDTDTVNFAVVQADAAPKGADSAIGNIITTTVSIAASGQVSAPNLGCGGSAGSTTITAVTSEDDTIDDSVDLTVDRRTREHDPRGQPGLDRLQRHQLRRSQRYGARQRRQAGCRRQQGPL